MVTAIYNVVPQRTYYSTYYRDRTLRKDMEVWRPRAWNSMNHTYFMPGRTVNA